MTRIAALAVVLVSGCGGAAALGPATARLPEPMRVTREMARTRRGSSDVVVIEAEVGEGGAMRLVRAVHEQGGQAVRALPPEARAHLSQRVDPESGAVVVAMDAELGFALGAELTTAVTLAPFGATGLARDGEGETTLALGVPPDSVIPRLVRVGCVRARPELLRCEGRLDRPIEADPAAATQGVRAELEGVVTLEVTRDEVGLERCELTLRLDVITRLGALEEHDANEVRLRTARLP